MPPKPEEIDILAMELEGKLPHWLDWHQRNPDKVQEIRDRNRAKWLAEQKQKKRTKAFQAAKAQAQATLDRTRAFDPGQPRDEHGRWTDTGADAADPESASALIKPEHVDNDQIYDSVPGSRAKVAAAKQKLADGVPTDAPVEKGGFKNPDGSWEASRAAAHDQILDKMFSSDAIAAATPKQGEQPVLHLLGGRGGSGKGWFTGPNGTVDKNNGLYLNNDDIKEALPGYQGWNAALLHEESSEIGNVVEAFAREHKLNVILDGTMRTGKTLAERVATYKAAGYRIEGHYMFASPATATKRALERFVRGGETGRFVSPEYALGSTTNEKSFDSVRDQMDAWEIYDNSGKAPKFHSRSK